MSSPKPRTRTIVCLAALVFGAAPSAWAGYPVLSKFTRTADGPYRPQVRKYVTIDPTPVAPSPAGGRFAQHAPAETGPLWARRDAGLPVYPYGWFGARHATDRTTRGSYYDDYREVNVLRGR